jgi:hypothetical protein
MTNIRRRLWKHGLLAALIGGFASSMDSGLALIVIAPDKFNLGLDLWRTLLTMLVLGLLSGAKVAAAYLKQSPFPLEDDLPAECPLLKQPK